MLPVDLVQAQRVGHDLDEPTVRACGEDLIGSEPALNLFELEYLVDLTDQLDRELLLPHFVVRLDYHSEEIPRLELAKG